MAGTKKSDNMPERREGNSTMKKRRILPMLSDLVQMTLTSCDGVLFDQCGACPHCGGELSGTMSRKSILPSLWMANRKGQSMYW